MDNQKQIKAKVVVIGAGPGGYTAAFRAADLLGEGVVLVEQSDLGGVCLNVGCIPSKTLLHVAEIINEAKAMEKHGVSFGAPKIDLDGVRAFKEKVVGRLRGGVGQLAKMRKVEVVLGKAQFSSPYSLEVKGETGNTRVDFEHAIIAVGSEPIHLPFLPDDPRIIDSTGALELEDIPEKMLIIGAGIIGLEMATVYCALGSKITVVELTDFILPGVDKDLSKPLYKFVEPKYESILLNAKVTKVEAKTDGLWVTFEGSDAPKEPQRFDKILSAVGRAPNGKKINADKAGIKVDERGFIPVDKQMRTNVSNIFAIGDVVGQPMLAHKAIPEGRVAAEVISGKKHFFNPLCIPSVAYTDPEVAWVGLSETQAKEQGLSFEKAVFPWMASGRSLSLGREEGLTKVIFDKQTHKVLGGGIVGPRAGDLIAELGLAIEMGCEAEDIALTIHPHPTVSETIALAAEIFEGTITDLPNTKK